MPLKERRALRPANPRVMTGGPSKLRGVIWHKSNGKWEARIYEAGKQRFLGYYTSEIAAARAYDTRAVHLHGSAAKVNFPEEYDETKNNPPAVKAAALQALTLARESSPEDLKRKSPRNSSWNSTTTRPLKRRDNNNDDDYILPVHLAQASYPQYGLRPASSRRHLSLCSAKASCNSEQDTSDSEEDHESLEQGAVEVLASFLSSSSSDASLKCTYTANKSQGLESYNIEFPLERACSPPTASTGASPAPTAKTREWTMPSLWVRPKQSTPSPAGSSCQLSGEFDVPAAKTTMKSIVEEDCAESLQYVSAPEADKPAKERTCPSLEASCSDEWIFASAHQKAANLKFKGVSWNSVCRKWVAVIWDRHAKRARHIGTFDEASDAARAYDREAAAMIPFGATLNFPGQLQPANSQPPDTKPLTISNWDGSNKVGAGKSQVGPESAHQGKITTAARAAAVGNGKQARGSSRFRGVSWCEKGQKWRALLWDGSRQHFLGHFKSEEEGARAYDRALLTRKKKDGCLNFPLSNYVDIIGDPAESDVHTFLKPGQPNATLPIGQKPISVSTPVLWERPPVSAQPTMTKAALADDISQQAQPSKPAAEKEEGSADFLERDDGLTRSKTCHGSSQYKGVSWSARSSKWRAQMWLGAKVLHLGFFDDEQAAAQAYDDAVAAHRGPEAAANFIAGGQLHCPTDDLDFCPDSGKDPSGLSSGFRGVRWHERNGKYEARIFDGQRQVSLGYHDSELLAAKAFDAAALQLRGPSTCTNFAAKAGPEAAVAEADPASLGSKCVATAGEGFLNTGWGSKRRRN